MLSYEPHHPSHSHFVTTYLPPLPTHTKKMANLQQLVQMGFKKNDALRALRLSGNDVESSMNRNPEFRL